MRKQLSLSKYQQQSEVRHGQLTFPLIKEMQTDDWAKALVFIESVFIACGTLPSPEMTKIARLKLPEPLR